MNKLLIWWHKRCARNARLRMISIADYYSCGITLLEYSSQSYIEAKNEYEYHLAMLKEIDPNFGKKS